MYTSITIITLYLIFLEILIQYYFISIENINPVAAINFIQSSPTSPILNFVFFVLLLFISLIPFLTLPAFHY